MKFNLTAKALLVATWLWPVIADAQVARVSKELLPGLRFVPIPAGSFVMGNSDTDQVKVTLGAFFMGATEVTQTQWEAVMGAGNNPSTFKGGTLPVHGVSWESAKEFCGKLTVDARSQKWLPEDWIIDLPTEAQWEYACRAGTTSSLNNGNDLNHEEAPDSSLDEIAWYRSNSDDQPHPVGSKKPNAWGLYDMHGNIFEWCTDYFLEKLPGGTDPFVRESRFCPVIRGGSWKAIPWRCRSAARFWQGPANDTSYVGMRLAIVPTSSRKTKKN